MNPITLEWIEKAEGDFITAGRELKARKSPNYDAVCFHSQQTAEKYLKAYLHESEQIIPKTHVLLDLLAICVKIDNTFLLIQPDVNALEGYAIQFRYPGQRAEKIDAKQAYMNAGIIRKFLRTKFS